MTDPEAVRVPKTGGGDYRLAATNGTWRLTEWTKGFGRATLNSGTDMVAGPPALINVMLSHAVPARQGLHEAYARLMRLDPAINRVGFRAGWHGRAAAQYQNDYRKLLSRWYNDIAVTIKAMQVANWPLDVEALAEYAESNLPTDINA